MRAMTLEEMKAVELEIMDEIDAICRQHGLTYFLGYGSVLGAVRHGGFIPWDDDIDENAPEHRLAARTTNSSSPTSTSGVQAKTTRSRSVATTHRCINS